MRFKTALLASAFAAASVAMAGGAVAAEYYAGKTITFIVGYNPGGGTDTTHRTHAPFFSKHIPGHPEVVVKNMPGAGGMKATNYVYERAKPDGLTILTNPINPIGALTGAPGLRADYTKFYFIGGSAEPRMTMVRTGALPGGKMNPLDLVKIKGKVKLAGLRATSNLDMVGRLTLELLDVDYQYVPGYSGASKRRAALLNGEADVSTTGMSDWRANIQDAAAKEGRVVALYYHPKIGEDGEPLKNPAITDMPDFQTFYEKATGKKPSGPKWELLKFVYALTSSLSQSIMAPPGTPPEAVAALRKGYIGVMNDPDLRALAIKRFGEPLSYISTAEGERVIKALLHADPKVVADLKTFIDDAKARQRP